MAKRLKSSRHKKHSSKTHTRRHVKKHTRKQTRGRRRGGMCSDGYSAGQSLMQGQNYEAIHVGQHGGETNQAVLHSTNAPGQLENRVNNSNTIHGLVTNNMNSKNVKSGGMYGPYPSAVTSPVLLSPDMQGPAMTSGTMAAYSQITGMVDPSPSSMLGGACQACGACGASSTKLSGGKKHRKIHSKRGKQGKTRKHVSGRRGMRGRHGSRRGGMTQLNPMSLPMQGLLLSPEQYTEAGLNPDYTGAAVEYTDAKARNST